MASRKALYDTGKTVVWRREVFLMTPGKDVEELGLGTLENWRMASKNDLKTPELKDGAGNRLVTRRRMTWRRGGNDVKAPIDDVTWKGKCQGEIIRRGNESRRGRRGKWHLRRELKLSPDESSLWAGSERPQHWIGMGSAGSWREEAHRLQVAPEMASRCLGELICRG